MSIPNSRLAQLYVGKTSHARFKPQPHKFRYDVFQILVDVDHLEEAFDGLRTASVGRFGLVSFHARDHGARDGSPLRGWVEAKLAAAGVCATAAEIRLLCFPRILGFVFNPLSIFFVYDAGRRLEAVIYEVNNTFGQTHAYVTPASGQGDERQEAEKAFFVSPFYGVEGGYRFRLSPPTDSFDLVICKHVDGKTDFVATLNAERRPMTDGALMRLFFAMPFMTLGVVAAIHWEALRLWLKGAPFYSRPRGPRAGASVGRASSAVL
jgi:DUF1365 family protein